MSDDCTHDYKPFGEPFYRWKPDYVPSPDPLDDLVGKYDESVRYSTLFCRKCGSTMEVVVADHRPGGGGAGPHQRSSPESGQSDRTRATES